MEIYDGNVPLTYDEWAVAVHGIIGVDYYPGRRKRRADRELRRIKNLDTPKDLAAILGPRMNVKIDGNFDSGYNLALRSKFGLKGLWTYLNRKVEYNITNVPGAVKAEITKDEVVSTYMPLPSVGPMGIGTTGKATIGQHTAETIESYEDRVLLLETIEAAAKANQNRYPVQSKNWS